MMRLISLCWLGLAFYEAFWRNDYVSANTAAIISTIFWVGAEIVHALKTSPPNTPKP